MRRNWGVGIYSVVILLILLIPIAYTITFSFNIPARTNSTWRGFSLDNWANMFADPRIVSAFFTSIGIGVLATLVAAAIGTAISIALVRFRFRFRTGLTILLFLPMATPEVVHRLGPRLAVPQPRDRQGARDDHRRPHHVLHHFVVITVGPGSRGSTPRSRRRRMDLYATPQQTVWWRVTFPLAVPRHPRRGAAVFALSFDDFIITAFVRGSTETFPTYIYTAAVRAIPAQANVFASVIFLLAIVIVLAQQLTAAARRRRLAREG